MPAPTKAGQQGPGALRRFVAPALFVLLVFGVYWRSTDDPQEHAQRALEAEHGVDITELSGEIFGTTFTVKVISDAELDDAQTAALTGAVQAALSQVDASMSTWKDDSELSRLNRHPVGEAFALSPPLAEVLGLAQRIHDRSGGAFDVTVGPLVNRWGFGPDGRPQAPPSGDELDALRAAVGQRHLTLDLDVPRAQRGVDGLYVDLSAIAKGHGVDAVSAALRGLGHDRHMVEIGGEVVTRGTNAQGGPWRIAVETPDVAARTPINVVPLTDAALATSGDYRNWIELDGERFSHTIDPRTGQPVSHTLASVSVVAPSCAEADAWATALTVLGPEEGMAIATQEGLAALFLVRGDAGFTQTASPAFAALSDPPSAP